MINFFKELRRRNVYKVATVYAITAWILAQIINLAADAFGAPEWVMQMVIILLIGGFPIALILAWAFELTPEGLRRTNPQEQSSITKTPSRNRFNLWIIGLLVMALLFLGFERIFFAESTIWQKDPETEQASIAVLPFADFSPDGDQEYFADGISDEILNSLAQVKGLQVAGRTSSFQFKNENRDLKEIGAKLGVNHILEGSVRKSGNQLRITAQLIKIKDGFHIWSNTYDRPYSAENIFDVQDQISREVLEELKIRLLLTDDKSLISSQPRPTENLEAYNLYLKGKAEAADLHPDGLEKAVQYFDAATKKDPDFALAYAKKAEALIFQFYFGNLEYEKMTTDTREAIDWAFIKNKDLAEAYSAMGWYHFMLRDNNKAVLALKTAKNLKPGDAEIRASYGVMLWQNRSMEEAKKELEYAYTLNPMSSMVNLYLGEIAVEQNELKKAEKYYLRAIDLRQHLLPAYEALSNLYGSKQGMHDKAIITMHKAKKKVAKNTPSVDIIFYPATDLGLHDLAEQQLKDLKKYFPHNISTFNSEMYSYLYHKKYDEMMDRLEVADSMSESLPDLVYLNRYSIPAMATGESQKFINKIKIKTPQLLASDSVIFREPYMWTSITAAFGLRKIGEQEKADTLISKLKSHLENFPEEDIRQYGGRYAFHYLLCRAYLGDKKYIKKYFQQRLEHKNVISHSVIFGVYNDIFFNLSQEELQPFKLKEEKIIKQQRENVIAYLKSEGEWNEDDNPIRTF